MYLHYVYNLYTNPTVVDLLVTSTLHNSKGHILSPYGIHLNALLVWHQKPPRGFKTFVFKDTQI